MITFSICLALLVTAYFTYGRYLERLVAIDDAAPTPCRRLYDGVDYVPLPRWRVFLIQLLNIAGTGPIFGAVLGATDNLNREAVAAAAPQVQTGGPKEEETFQKQLLPNAK